MEGLFLLVLALTQLHTIHMQQILSLSNEKCSISPSANEDIKSMVTLMYERGEKQRADRNNSKLRNNNIISYLETESAELRAKVIEISNSTEKIRADSDIATLRYDDILSDLKTGMAELRAKVTEISNSTEKQRVDRDNATLRNNDIASNLKKEIAELRAKVTEISISTTQAIDNVRKIDMRLHLSEDGNVFVKDDMAYLVSDKRLSWHQAWSFCRRKDAILANIHNSSVNRYLTSKLADYRDDFWIGGIKEFGVYSWRTESGHTPMTWSNWAPGEPINYPKCVLLWKSRVYKWDNARCIGKNRFLCSKSLL